MSETFNNALKQVTDWISAYQDNIRDYPVVSQQAPGELLKNLPAGPSDEAEGFETIFKDFRDLIVPGITHWQHPKFFGYFPANSSPPSILAEMLIAAMGVQGMSWSTSPAATELEIRVMEWLREALGFDQGFTGVIQDSASSSTTIAMLVARERATDFTVNERGYQNYQLTAYCSEEAHSSVEKAAKVIGIGRENLRKVPVDDHQQMRIDLLEQMIKDDRAAGKQPFFVVGAFGTTGTTACDDLAAINQIAKKNNLWFHVDAAYAGSALILPEIRHLADGINDADSIVVNPHKWLFTTFDCSAFFVKHPQALVDTLAILPEYLKTFSDGQVVNFRDWGLGLGRRFRSLKLWFVMRWYGIAGMQEMIRNQIHLTKTLASKIADDPRFEIKVTGHFNLLCFRLRGSCLANKELMQRLNESGKLFLTHTKINGQIVLRLAVGQMQVTAADIDESWATIASMAPVALSE